MAWVFFLDFFFALRLDEQLESPLVFFLYICLPFVFFILRRKEIKFVFGGQQ